MPEPPLPAYEGIVTLHTISIRTPAATQTCYAVALRRVFAVSNILHNTSSDTQCAGDARGLIKFRSKTISRLAPDAQLYVPPIYRTYCCTYRQLQ
ncbi:hypothetical protein EVAR_59269_1 [Eumeta japonica]|uniref:Uncharacterized protein n=1 Tax=Eumeta variegata TaxID=151549 RepID=A0A4C1YN36_EUMVA|nr:hypothetical protein EVAR_59269_1 [Eumeta japonica]